MRFLSKRKRVIQSEVSIQHDAVTGLAGFQPSEGFVDFAHREMLGLRRDVVARGKVEHRLDCRRRTGWRTRDAALARDEREGRDWNRFKDTRTDIYSLGVLLYELLTGSTPFDTGELLKAGLDEVRRVIREQEPAPPSTA